MALYEFFIVIVIIIFICLFVSLRNIFWGHGMRNNPLDFDGSPDQNSDPGFLGRNPDPGIF